MSKPYQRGLGDIPDEKWDAILDAIILRCAKELDTPRRMGVVSAPNVRRKPVDHQILKVSPSDSLKVFLSSRFIFSDHHSVAAQLQAVPLPSLSASPRLPISPSS